MPKFYCEYCGIYLTHSSPSGRKQHSLGRKHIQSKIDFYSQLLIEAHQEGSLNKVTNLFQGQDNMPNMKNDTIRNPYNNQTVNTYDFSSMKLEGIAPSSISYMVIPGMNVAVPVNPSDKLNVQKALQNLLPSVVLDQMPRYGNQQLQFMMPPPPTGAAHMLHQNFQPGQLHMIPPHMVFPQQSQIAPPLQPGNEDQEDVKKEDLNE